MNETELKKATEIMVAAAKKLTIQVRSKSNPKGRWTVCKNPAFNWEEKEYRVKPEPSFRPYTWEEFATALKEHGPAIQMKLKASTWDTAAVDVIVPCNFSSTTINYFTDRATMITYKELCDGSELYDFRWAADKAPCGILVTDN